MILSFAITIYALSLIPPSKALPLERHGYNVEGPNDRSLDTIYPGSSLAAFQVKVKERSIEEVNDDSPWYDIGGLKAKERSIEEVNDDSPWYDIGGLKAKERSIEEVDDDSPWYDIGGLKIKERSIEKVDDDSP
ncbi:hypothetical protein MMC11_000938 [Xylographa trunciseda]|nr:hypothetical protein [Xylographa trunciseda]